MTLFGLENYSYHGSIRRYVALFGSLFTDLYIKRLSEDKTKEDFIKVPISYGTSNMFMKAPQDQTRETGKVARILPAMAFELDNFYMDTSRKTNPLNRIQGASFNVDGKKNSQMNRVPYTFIFSLKIRTKNMDDMLQISEQIIPLFDSSLSITIEDCPGVEVDQDIIMKIEEVAMSDNYDSEMAGRLIEWTITFELKGFLYKRTISKYVVKEIDIVSIVGEDAITGEVGGVESIFTQPPITDLQNIVSGMMVASENIESTTDKVKVRRKRKVG